MLLAGLDPIKAYGGLLQGAIGTDSSIVRSLIKMAPLILAGLAVAFAFKGGLFNIGAQGQLVVGALLSAWVGFALEGLPPAIHIVLSLLAGLVGGALWGMIPGLLKAFTGAHEVISTIMLNYVATLLLEWAVSPARTAAPPGPLAFCKTVGSCAIGQTPEILPSAMLPNLYRSAGSNPEALHIGVFLAILVAFVIYILVYRTTFGFELRMVGLNPSAARYSGINVARMTVLTMMIAGGLAGLAGAIQTLGVNYRFQVNQSLSIGFDSIAVSLLASNNPLAIIPSALLFGAMSAGGTQMQSASRVPVDLIQVIQALILTFVAADQIIRSLYRIRAGKTSEKVKLSTGWGHR
ncbi:MAG: ABC transporter permease [Anaerolineae bacterium]|nr:ABC transporter permease [Anaerolineae bacterium]